MWEPVAVVAAILALLLYVIVEGEEIYKGLNRRGYNNKPFWQRFVLSIFFACFYAWSSAMVMYPLAPTTVSKYFEEIIVVVYPFWLFLHTLGHNSPKLDRALAVTLIILFFLAIVIFVEVE